MVIPWLNPFAWGPSPAVAPLLVSWVCILCVAWTGQITSMHHPEFRIDRTPALTFGLLLSALVSSGIGLLQYFGLADLFSFWINAAAVGEAFSNLRQRNQFASLVNIGLIALIWCVARVSPTYDVAKASVLASRSNWLSIGALPAAVLLGIGNAASSSRTGLLQLLLVVVLCWWWGVLRHPATRNAVWAAALAYAVASVVLPLLIGMELGSSGILGRLNDGGAACSSRLTLWRNVLHLIAQKPWFGWGWGELDYAHFVTLYPGPRFCEILDNAHNLPLHLAVELGIPLALLVCGGGLWLIWRAKPWWERDATRQMAWGVLAVIMLHSLLEYPLWYGPFQMAFGLCVWLLIVTPAVNEKIFTTKVVKWGAIELSGEKNALNRHLALVLVRLFAIIVAIFVLYAGWDYHRISQIYLAPSQRSEAYRVNTLAKIQGSWLFENQVKFAELTTTALTAQNALRLNAMALDLLHFSPEARVAEKLIESAKLLGQNAQAGFYSIRYRAAFPVEYARWASANPSIAR